MFNVVKEAVKDMAIVWNRGWDGKTVRLTFIQKDDEVIVKRERLFVDREARFPVRLPPGAKNRKDGQRRRLSAFAFQLGSNSHEAPRNAAILVTSSLPFAPIAVTGTKSTAW